MVGESLLVPFFFSGSEDDGSESILVPVFFSGSEGESRAVEGAVSTTDKKKKKRTHPTHGQKRGELITLVIYPSAEEEKKEEKKKDGPSQNARLIRIPGVKAVVWSPTPPHSTAMYPCTPVQQYHNHNIYPMDTTALSGA